MIGGRIGKIAVSPLQMLATNIILNDPKLCMAVGETHVEGAMSLNFVLGLKVPSQGARVLWGMEISIF